MLHFNITASLMKYHEKVTYSRIDWSNTFWDYAHTANYFRKRVSVVTGFAGQLSSVFVAKLGTLMHNTTEKHKVC